MAKYFKYRQVDSWYDMSIQNFPGEVVELDREEEEFAKHVDPFPDADPRWKDPFPDTEYLEIYIRLDGRTKKEVLYEIQLWTPTALDPDDCILDFVEEYFKEETKQ